MATNKNQHFVPRCYLRPFSLAEEGRCIDVFNIDRMRLIKRAALKHQCSGDYFYGEDPKLEDAIRTTEGAYSQVLRALRKPGSRPSDDHRALMRIFWFLQYMRTEAAAKKSMEMLESMGDTFQLRPEDFNMGIKEAVQEALRVFGEEIHLVRDMHVAFGKNKTDAPLLTSDDPAVLLNKWHQEDPACKGMSFGLVAAGNLMILPISPNIVFIGYDSGVYSVPKERGWFSISKESDIYALNYMQALNCNANLYVPSGCSEQYLWKMIEETKAVRPESSHKVCYFVEDREYDGYTRYRVVDRSELEDHQEAVLQVRPIHPKPKYWPTCIRWRNRGRAYSDGSAVGYVRYAVAMSKTDRRFQMSVLRRGRIQ